MDDAAEPYLALIDRLGRRSTGDNLLGFRVDLDFFLGRAAGIDAVTTRVIATDEVDAQGAMLVTVAHGRDLAAMRAAIVDCWITSLRYRGNERHRFDDEGTFHYATWTPSLGVVGRIACEVAPR